MLPPSVESLWQQYLESERTLTRGKIRLSLLNRFIEGILALPENEWKSWALKKAELVAGRGEDIPVRLPLFQSVLLPALIEGVVERKPGCARWLAHFERLFYQCAQAQNQLPEHMRTSWGLLEEALRLDPNDDIARKHLVKLTSSYLEYCLHELPTGVLYGANGATAEQCEELSQLLAEFEKHLEVLGLSVEYQDLITKCTFHFTHYRDYLLAGCPGMSYERYLSQLKNN